MAKMLSPFAKWLNPIIGQIAIKKPTEVGFKMCLI